MLSYNINVDEKPRFIAVPFKVKKVVVGSITGIDGVSTTEYDTIIPFLSRSGGGIHKISASVSEMIKNWTSVGLVDGTKAVDKVLAVKVCRIKRNYE